MTGPDIGRFSRALAVGAHTDDVELACGATLARLKRQGTEVAVAAFSRAEASLPDGVPVDELEREFRAAMGVLGADDIYVGGVPVRNFGDHRQHVLDELILLRQRYEPDLVLTMNGADTHQDHAIVHEESLRAFRGITMLGYELPWNQRTSANDVFVEISDADLAVKQAMVAEYNTQAQLQRPYARPEAVHAAAVFRGTQGRVALAEMFECISVVWRDS